MEVATFVIAVFGAVLSSASFAWQAVTYVMSGGRVKTELLVGVKERTGPGMIVSPAKSATQSMFDQLADYGKPIIAVRVRNVGRLPITITAWGIKSQSGVALSAGRLTIGPDLPHRLEAGSMETWAVDLKIAEKLVAADARVLKIHKSYLQGTVELGNGRAYKTRSRFKPLDQSPSGSV